MDLARPQRHRADRCAGRSFAAALAATAASVVLGAALAAPGPAAVAQPPAPPGDARLGEPIVVPASAMERLFGTPAGQLYAYALRDGSWARIALQLDERTDGGAVLADDQGDGTLSANDELVLLLDEAGERAEAGAAPGGMTGATGRAEVRASEPGNPDAAAYAYVFRHPAGPEDAPPRRLAWDDVERRLASEAYVLGLADPAQDAFIGIEHLSLGDGPDLLDRLKFRGTLDALGLPIAVSEESFSSPLLDALIGDADLTPDPIKVGPVRAVFGLGEASMLYPRRGAFVTGLEAFGELGAGPLPIALRDVRVSLDLLPSAAGADYADANVPGGVPIDGQPDDVPEAPLPAYRELRLPAGRIVLLPAAGAEAQPDGARAFYADDAAGLPDDTGDGQSWGEHGVAADEAEGALAAGFPGRFVVLPPGSTVSGDEVVAAAASPLEVAVTDLEAADTPTPEATPTRAPTATPSPTTQPESGRIHLPWCGSRAP